MHMAVGVCVRLRYSVACRRGTRGRVRHGSHEFRAGLTDVLALIGNDRPHRTLRNTVADWLLKKPMHDLAQVNELFLSLGVKDLTEEGHHYANDPK